MLSATTITLLEKAATDNGFDLELEHTADWLSFGSSQTSTDIWLTVREDPRVLAALSRPDVLDGLPGIGSTSTDPLPSGAAGALAVDDIAALHAVLRRAFHLSRTLPDALLHVFETETANLPRTTEAERLVVQRVGQDIFRRGLLEYWDGRCAITGLDVPELLRASHIKPWADCDADAERLDVFNGLLLAHIWTRRSMLGSLLSGRMGLWSFRTLSWQVPDQRLGWMSGLASRPCTTPTSGTCLGIGPVYSAPVGPQPLDAEAAGRQGGRARTGGCAVA